MRIRTSHSSLFLSIAESIKEELRHGNLYQSLDSLIIFTCGAASTKKNKAKREYLIEYSKKHFTEARFFRAEDAFPVFTNQSSTDLLSIEGELAKFSDCVLIVVESPGACAELGAFANDDKLVKKLFIINDSEHKKGESFISKGPIAKADKQSLFKPTVYVDLNKIAFVAQDVCDRIRTVLSRKRRTTVSFASYDCYNKRTPKEILLFINDLVSIFSPLHRSELILILKRIIDDKSYDVDTYLSLLKAMELIDSDGKDLFYRIGDEYRYAYEYPRLDHLSLRSRVINFYSKHARSRLDLLIKRANR